MGNYMILFKRNFDISYKMYFGTTASQAVEKALDDNWKYQGWEVIAVFPKREWIAATRRR